MNAMTTFTAKYVADADIQPRLAHVTLWQRIKLLQHKRGYCWATNEQIAEMLHISASYVSHLITDLVRLGCVARQVMYREDTHEVVGRMLLAFDEPKETMDEAFASLVKIAQMRDEKGQRMRLAMNARQVGLNPNTVWEATLKYGIARVDQAMANIMASSTVKNVYAYFYGFLQQGWQCGKRAQRYVGKAYATKRHAMPAMFHGAPMQATGRDDQKNAELYAMLDKLNEKRKAHLTQQKA